MKITDKIVCTACKNFGDEKHWRHMKQKEVGNFVTSIMRNGSRLTILPMLLR